MSRYWVKMEGAVEGPYEAAALRFVEGFARDALVSPETGSETWVRADEIAELKTLLETGRVHVPVPAEMPAPPEIPKPFERTIPPAEFRAAPAPAAPPAVPKTPEPFRDGTADPSVTAIDIPFKTIFAVLLLLAALAGMFWKRTDFAVVARDWKNWKHWKAAVTAKEAVAEPLPPEVQAALDGPAPVRPAAPVPAGPPIRSLKPASRETRPVEAARPAKARKAKAPAPSAAKPKAKAAAKPKPKPSSDGKAKLGAAALPGFTAKGQKFLLPGVPAPEQ